MFETSIVIPAYNESKRIPDTLERLFGQMKSGVLEPVVVREIIVVDDGSADETCDVVRKYLAAHPELKVVTSPRNFGKGHAVRQGMLNATAPWVLVADADMSTPWPEVVKLAHACAAHSALVAIGSRDVKGSEIKRHQSFVREHLGKSFNVFVRMLTGLPFKDTQCGFKFFRKEAVSGFFPYLKVDRFAWDVEFLIHVRRLGLEILEVPVVWEHKDESRVRVFRDGFGMLSSVIKVRVEMRLMSARRLLS